MPTKLPPDKSQAGWMALSSFAKASEDRPVPPRERIAPWGHAPLRGSRHLVPSTLRSTATEDGRA